MNELIQIVFATRNAAHLEHWRTESYAKHVALGAFYDDIIESIDKLVEAYQGAFDIVNPKPKDAETVDITKRLKADLVFISKNRAQITQGLPALDNILQELEGHYLKTIFFLERLN